MAFADLLADKHHVLPCFTELYMSRIDRSKWNGACEEKRRRSSAQRCRSTTRRSSRHSDASAGHPLAAGRAGGIENVGKVVRLRRCGIHCWSLAATAVLHVECGAQVMTSSITADHQHFGVRAAIGKLAE